MSARFVWRLDGVTGVKGISGRLFPCGDDPLGEARRRDRLLGARLQERLGARAWMMDALREGPADAVALSRRWAPGQAEALRRTRRPAQRRLGVRRDVM